MTLDGVAGQRERRAGKADQRHLVLEFAAQDLDRLHHIAGGLVGICDTQLLDIGGRAYRVVNDGTLAFGEFEIEPHAGERDEDVREHDRCVHAHQVNGLQRHLNHQLGCAAHLEEAVLGANRAILLHVASGLTHHPYGSALGRLIARGAKE